MVMGPTRIGPMPCLSSLLQATTLPGTYHDSCLVNLTEMTLQSNTSSVEGLPLQGRSRSHFLCCCINYTDGRAGAKAAKIMSCDTHTSTCLGNIHLIVSSIFNVTGLMTGCSAVNGRV